MMELWMADSVKLNDIGESAAHEVFFLWQPMLRGALGTQPLSHWSCETRMMGLFPSS